MDPVVVHLAGNQEAVGRLGVLGVTAGALQVAGHAQGPRRLLVAVRSNARQAALRDGVHHLQHLRTKA